MRGDTRVNMDVEGAPRVNMDVERGTQSEHGCYGGSPRVNMDVEGGHPE